MTVNGDTVKMDGSDAFKKDVNKAIALLAKNKRTEGLLKLVNSQYVYIIKETNNISEFDNNVGRDKNGEPQFAGGGTIYWNPKLGVETENGIRLSPTSVFDHEVNHGVGNSEGPQKHQTRSFAPDKKFKNKEERRVITTTEQATARALGEIKKGQITRKKYVVEALILNMPDPTSNKGGIRIKN